VVTEDGKKFKEDDGIFEFGSRHALDHSRHSSPQSSSPVDMINNPPYSTLPSRNSETTASQPELANHHHLDTAVSTVTTARKRWFRNPSAEVVA
jgi:hypothetical protein